MFFTTHLQALGPGGIVGVGVGVAIGVGARVPGSDVGVGAAVGPAWAIADQIVTANATIMRKPTTEGRVVAFDTVPPLCVGGFNGAKCPTWAPSTLELIPSKRITGKVSSLSLKLYFVINVCCLVFFLTHKAKKNRSDTAAGRLKPRPNGI
jgi:hypothetical protein